MNQAAVEPLVSKLKFAIKPTYRRLKNPDGSEGRLNKLRKTVSALIQHERIEVFYQRGDEARGYAERLISEAIRHGDAHAPTMELADYWLLNKESIHKLFKVLVPRFEKYNTAYTRLLRAPQINSMQFECAILELRGNPFPSLRPNTSNKYYIHNVLLDAAKFEYRREKYAQVKNEEIKEEAVEKVPEEIS